MKANCRNDVDWVSEFSFFKNRTDQFLNRAEVDRPAVAPEESKNLPVLRQFVEISYKIVVTAGYSRQGAIQAFEKFVESSLVAPHMDFGQCHPVTCIAVAGALAC